MNKLNLKIKNIALGDMEKIADYITDDNKSASLKMLKLFYKSFRNFIKNSKIQIYKGHLKNKLRTSKVHERTFRPSLLCPTKTLRSISKENTILTSGLIFQ